MTGDSFGGESDREITMTAADIALTRGEWQEVVFDKRPKRVALLSLQPRWQLQTLRISILRNHAVEPTLSVLRPFLAYAGYALDVSISGYDDSISAAPLTEADAHVVWLDPARYAAGGVQMSDGWLAERVRWLRSAVRGPILLIDAPSDRENTGFNEALRVSAAVHADVHVFPFSAVAADLGDDASEARSATTGTRVSGAAALLTAQRLGLQWIPALVRPRIKAVAVDLDETIVGGVLSEDGVHQLRTGDSYARLRARLLELHDQGVLLALVTRNDSKEVEQLFKERHELTALGAAFVAIEAGWTDKSASVRTIADRLNISTDSLLVVDDNPAEIAAMAAGVDGASFIVARDPESTARALSLHPGLLSTRVDDHAFRAADIRARERRLAEMSEAADPAAYLESLRMQAQLSMDRDADRVRLSELSRKTNQFNTSLRRLTETDVAAYIEDPDRRAVSMRLRDRLSDSGVIGVAFARRVGEHVVIDEIAISCRALGRSIETPLLREAIAGIAASLKAERVVIPFVAGPRNQPAAAWLSAVATPVADGEYEFPTAVTPDATPRDLSGLDVRWDRHSGD